VRAVYIAEVEQEDADEVRLLAAARTCQTFGPETTSSPSGFCFRPSHVAVQLNFVSHWFTVYESSLDPLQQADRSPQSSSVTMEKPHKAHHKPSVGSKAAKKDAANDIDRSGGKSYNPKVSAS